MPIPLPSSFFAVFYLIWNEKKNQAEKKEKIRQLCREAGGENSQALLAFVTSDKSATEVCMAHFISKATLYRAVQRYYEGFPKWL